MPPNGRITMTATPSSAASGSSRSLRLALVGVQRELDDVEAAGLQRALELAERVGAPVRDADAVEAPFGLLLLEPREVLLPRDEVVHLLDLDPPEEPTLLLVLRAALVHARRPDLRRDRRSLAPTVECRTERRLRAAVHRGRVEDGRAGAERRVHHGARARDISVERVVGTEPDDGPEPAYLHASAHLACDLDERERHLDHPFEVGHGDVLVGRVDLHHPVREVHALQATRVEHVRVRAAA